MSIPATLLSYRLILEPGVVPSRTRVLAFVALMLPWANLHSLFALGPLLLFAGLLGLVLRGLLEWWTVEPELRATAIATTRTIALWVALAIGCGIAISILNPRGIEQHLTFFSSNRDAAIWAVKDEWSHFNPLDPSLNTGSVGPLSWFLTDAIFASFAVASLYAGWRCIRRRDGGLLRFDPVLFGLGLSGVVASLVSIRFLWMAFFPMLFALRVLSVTPMDRGGRRTVSWLLALATLCVSVQFYRVGGYRNVAARVPSDPGAYLATPYVSRKYHVEGVRFLKATGVEGNLFNSYGMGGFPGYWLLPRLRTFIDSRTEHYAAVKWPCGMFSRFGFGARSRLSSSRSQYRSGLVRSRG